jgi:hypothetical protein
VIRVFGLLFAIALFTLFGWLAGTVARRKGRPFWLYFVAAWIVGPLALFGALLLPRARR